MARPIWQGTITFGLVTVPVALYSATTDRDVQFHQLQRGTGDRIRYRRVNERTGEEVDYADIVKGYEVSRGEYVVVEPDELADIAPGRSRSIEIEAFVELGEIDPIFFRRAYWLAPANEDYAHAYYLLLRAMARTNRVGIAMFVMRGKQYLTAVRAGHHDILTLETLYFADEVREPSREIPNLPEPDAPRERELAMAGDLIESMTGPWEPDSYHDTYREKVLQLIEDKRAGRQVRQAEEPAPPTKVVDLTDALRRSMRGDGRTRRGAAGRAEPEPGLDELSKADLDRMARELDIPGRSKMRRDDLVAAIRQARADRPRPRRRRVS